MITPWSMSKTQTPSSKKPTGDITSSGNWTHSVYTNQYCKPFTVLSSRVCWFTSPSVKNRNHLQAIVVCSKISGVPLRSLASFFEQQARRKAYEIMGNSTMSSTRSSICSPLGCRLCFLKCSTNGHRALFVPEANRLVNRTINEDLGTILEIINGRAKLRTVATTDLNAPLTDALMRLCLFKMFYLLSLFALSEAPCQAWTNCLSGIIKVDL